MDKGTYAKYKRCLEWYSVDPDFRSLMESDPERAADSIGLNGKTEGEKVKKTIRTILFDKNNCSGESELSYLGIYNAYVRKLADRTVGIHSENSIPDPKIFQYLDTVRNRCRMESSAIKQNNLIYYYPFSFELSSGCTVQCPFCGLRAKPFKCNFEYTRENAEIFNRAVSVAAEFSGDIAGSCPLYFASEPMDNPDYEKFVRDVIEITGHVPQTTTALAEKYPERIKAFMEFLGNERLRNYAALRFSIRSIPQFKKIMSLYTPEELIDVELLANNKESVNRYSASGKTLDIPNLTDVKKVKYSICCTAGIKIDFCNKTLDFIEPELPDEKNPLGYSVKLSRNFSDSYDLEDVMRDIISIEYKGEMEKEAILHINSNIRIIEDKGMIIFLGDGVGYKIFNNEINSAVLEGIKEEKSFESITKDFSEDERALAFDTFSALFKRGYIRH